MHRAIILILLAASLLAAAWSAPSPTTDEGCILDPDGRPACAHPSPTIDEGCILDPDGRPACVHVLKRNS